MITNEIREMVKSWAKVFLAASFALYLSGSRDLMMLLEAGVAAVLPLIISWLDPKDMRFGRIEIEEV